MALSKEQLELRKHTIGSSEVAAICGESPWESPLDVYHRKTQGVEKEETEAMRRGTAFEPVIAELYAQEHLGSGEDLVNPERTLIHPTTRWASATPDRQVTKVKLVGTPPVGRSVMVIQRLVELKRTKWRMAHRWQDGEAPKENILQAAWQMAVCDVDLCHLFALIGGDELVLVPIERDKELEAMLFEIVENFVVNHWRKGIPPDPGKSEAAKAALVKLYPRHIRPELLPAAPSIDEAAFRLARFKWLLKQVDAGVTENENIIKAYVSDAMGVEGEGWKATWKSDRDGKTVDGKTVDWKAVAEDLFDRHIEGVGDMTLGEFAHDYTTTKPGPRRFLFKQKEMRDGELEYREVAGKQIETLALGGAERDHEDPASPRQG